MIKHQMDPGRTELLPALVDYTHLNQCHFWMDFNMLIMEHKLILIS